MRVPFPPESATAIFPQLRRNQHVLALDVSHNATMPESIYKILHRHEATDVDLGMQMGCSGSQHRQLEIGPFRGRVEMGARRRRDHPGRVTPAADPWKSPGSTRGRVAQLPVGIRRVEVTDRIVESVMASLAGKISW